MCIQYQQKLSENWAPAVCVGIWTIEKWRDESLNVSGLQAAECSRADSADAGQEAIGFTEAKQDAVWCGGLW
jgi:hypothetical protein